MTVRIAISILMIIVLSGCATSQKQRKEKQEVNTYDIDPEVYYKESVSAPALKYVAPSAKPAGKKYSKTAQLSARQIQTALKNAGYYQGSIDGVIGPKTKSAILKFQRAHDLKADGIVGKNTSAKLSEYLYR